MLLNKRSLGLSLGVVLGLFVLLGTWWLVIIGSAGATISKLHKFFAGYSLSWMGGLLGAFWAFVYGFIAGYLIAWLYNLMSPQSTKPD